jgi:hypothetical protein
MTVLAILYPLLALALFVAVVWLTVAGIRRNGLAGALPFAIGGAGLIALGAWFASTQPPALGRRVVRSVRNWKCPNGRTIDENIVDHFTRAGRPPVRLDWSAHLVEDIPFDWKVREAHCKVVLPDGTAPVLSFWPGSFFGGSVAGGGWDAVEACPGIEPTELLLHFEKEDFYWKWARFGREYALGLIHPERFRWQKRNGFEADDRLSFEAESGVDPAFVRAALEVAKDRNDFAKCRAHALEELRALPEIPEDLAAEVARLLAADDSHAKSAEGAEPESHAEGAETAEPESHAEGAETAEPESHAENAETELHAESADGAE